MLTLSTKGKREQWKEMAVSYLDCLEPCSSVFNVSFGQDCMLQ